MTGASVRCTRPSAPKRHVGYTKAQRKATAPRLPFSICTLRTADRRNNDNNPRPVCASARLQEVVSQLLNRRAVTLHPSPRFSLFLFLLCLLSGVAFIFLFFILKLLKCAFRLFFFPFFFFSPEKPNCVFSFFLSSFSR